eukprot:m.42890 g.42890  ORF g.42890 m.42890 type:complete len:476 (-) comp7082_c1_seq1:36-1463(-)
MLSCGGLARLVMRGFLGVGVVSTTTQASARLSVAASTQNNETFNDPGLLHEENFDVVIVGAGIVGVATANEILSRFPTKTVCVVEKEGEIAPHQTGHNSGVIHAGMYYQPGSTMAKCCVRGASLMYEYCELKNLPHKRCGKLIVASKEEEHHWVEMLHKRGNENGVKGLEIVMGEDIQKHEPNVRGYSALYSPNTGIADFGAVARQLGKDIIDSKRGSVRLRFEVNEFQEDQDHEYPIAVYGCEPGQNGPTRVVRAKNVITCAGLYADRVAKLAGGSDSPKVIPFRGRYYQMKPEYSDIVSMNVYPVPTGGGIPVGVHFTPTVNERRGENVIVGPGACLAFDREGYKFSDVSFRDLFDIVTQVGLINFVRNNFKLSFGELYRDLNKSAFMKEASKLIPSVKEDMTEASFSGVMVQVINDDGSSASDFIFERKALHGTTLHVRSAPSPACTSSLAIAEWVVNVASEDFHWEQQQKE